MKYKSYHTCVKICYALGIEKQLISKEFIAGISPSTSHYWKSTRVDKYLGSEFATSVDSNLGDIQIVLDQRLQKTKKMYLAICRLQLTIINLIGIKNFRAIITKNKNTVVNTIALVASELGGSRLVCRFLKIKHRSYILWKRYQAYSCPTSPLNLCFKRMPQQATFSEINVLKKYLTHKRYLHWSVAGQTHTFILSTFRRY